MFVLYIDESFIQNISKSVYILCKSTITLFLTFNSIIYIKKYHTGNTGYIFNDLTLL